MLGYDPKFSDTFSASQFPELDIFEVKMPSKKINCFLCDTNVNFFKNIYIWRIASIIFDMPISTKVSKI